MRMRKLILLTGIATFLLFSCNHGFLKDPRLYNAKKKTADTSITVAPEPTLELTGGVDAFDLDDWFNKPNSNGDATSPDKLDFPNTDFETMSLVGTYFNNSNVPVYAMKNENVWVSKDASKAEFVHAKAPDTTGQGYGISNVYWYAYRGKNPLYAPDGAYNTQLQQTAEKNPKLSRFYFYRFTGDTLSPSLDNFLFAVDSYSKLMFAFAYPTKTENVLGSNVPKAWGPTDGNAFLGTSYQFYMFDPVGYVEKIDGKYNVVMYEWFQNNLAKGIYQPTLGGLNDKSQGTALTTVAEKKPDGQGTSPFNNHTVDFFSQNMEMLVGKTFQRREKVGDEYGLVLYKYSIEESGEQIIIKRTAESWKGFETKTSLDPVEYTIGEGISATEGKLSLGADELTFSLTNVSKTLTIVDADGKTLEEAVSDFSDPTPSFRQRVKGATFQKGVTKYEFSEDASSLTWTWDGGEKTYTWDGSASDTEYTTYGGYRIRLYSNDFTIRGATLPNFGALSVMEYEAVRDVEKGATFTESVRGKPFSYREKDNGNRYDLSLMTLEFSADGKQATLYQEDWLSARKVVQEFDVNDNGASDSATIGGKNATLTATEDDPQWKVDYNGNTYTYGYDDHGPAFINRVKYDVTFVSEDQKTVYRFSNNGQRLHMTYAGSGDWWTFGLDAFDRTYEYQNEVATNSKDAGRAVYWARDGIAGFSFAGFELSNSDMLVKATNASASGAGAVDWTVAGLGYEAYRDENTKGIPTEADFEAFYDSLKATTFWARNLENDVAGLELLTWTFDDNRGGTQTKQIWLSSDTSTEETIPGLGIQAISRTTGSYTVKNKDGTNTGVSYFFSYAPDVGTLDVTKRDSNGQVTSLTYYDSSKRTDKGPAFINRVKGKTYRNSDDSDVYIFSADGKTLTMDGDNYTYCDERDAETGKSRAVYKWNWAQFYGLELSDDDKTIKMTRSSSYKDTLWGTLGWTATRTN